MPFKKKKKPIIVAWGPVRMAFGLPGHLWQVSDPHSSLSLLLSLTPKPSSLAPFAMAKFVTSSPSVLAVPKERDGLPSTPQASTGSLVRQDAHPSRPLLRCRALSANPQQLCTRLWWASGRGAVWEGAWQGKRQPSRGLNHPQSSFQMLSCP